jgi:hypothetical protein
MQSRRRLNLAIRLVFFAFVAGLFGLVPQSSPAQATSSLPKSWNEAVIGLADKIAAAVSPTAPVALDVKNISSLDAANMDSIRTALENELRRHSFQISPANSGTTQSAVHLQFTLSESADGYVWVVEIPNNSQNAPSTSPIIVPVPRTVAMEENTDQPLLSLEKRIVWKQSDRFLGFALLQGSSPSESQLLILETSRLAVYKLSGSQWQLSRTLPVPDSSSTSHDTAINDRSFSLGNLDCLFGPDPAGNIVCGMSRISRLTPDRATIAGVPTTVSTFLQEKCGSETMLLATGEGDWTQADTVQGYVTGANSGAAPSGASLAINGPVMSLEPGPATNAARAVVHNLKTGNYEAYIVTATCGH